MLIKYTLTNNFSYGNKNIVLPVGTNSDTVDDNLRDIIYRERKKAIDESKPKSVDLETIKYSYPDNTVNNKKGLLINFRFWNSTASTYSTSYDTVGFTKNDLSLNTNAFKRSFFRLYFYNSNTGTTVGDLIFTEDINIYGTTEAVLPFNRFYWLRTDRDFIGNNNNKNIYMDARFFNAKDGTVRRFINPNPNGSPPVGALTITEYSANNQDWRTSAITIINPRNNNGMYNFTPVVPSGANQISVITLSEFIMV